MSNSDKQELTADQYKVEVLKARIGQIVAEYEERIANYEIALVQAKNSGAQDDVS